MEKKFVADKAKEAAQALRKDPHVSASLRNIFAPQKESLFASFQSGLKSLDLTKFDAITFLAPARIPGNCPRIHFAFINGIHRAPRVPNGCIIASGTVQKEEGAVRWERYIDEGLKACLAKRDDSMPALCPAPVPLTFLYGKPLRLETFVPLVLELGIVTQKIKEVDSETLVNMTAVSLLAFHLFF